MRTRLSADRQPLWLLRIRAAIRPFGQQTAIASAAGMSGRQLKRIAMGGIRSPGICTLDRIAQGMGLTLVELLADAPRPKRGSGPTEDLEHHLGALIAQLKTLRPQDRAVFVRAAVSLLDALQHLDRERIPRGRRAATPRSRPSRR